MIDWLRDHWVDFSWALLIASLVGWPSTHALMLVADPPENTWVFHVLLAISFLALIYGALGIIVAAEVRENQREDG